MLWKNRRHLVLVVLALGLAACQGAAFLRRPTATPTPAMTLELGDEVYTHPQGAFVLPIPAGWQVALEEPARVRLTPGPHATPSSYHWVELAAINTAVPLEDAALDTFARQFAQDVCAAVGPCEVRRVWLGSAGRAHADARVVTDEGEARWHFVYQRQGPVVFVWHIASDPSGVPDALVSAWWHYLRLDAAKAQGLPLYGYRRIYTLSLPHHPEMELQEAIPVGWRVTRARDVQAVEDVAYALALSPDSRFGLLLYSGHQGHPALSDQDLRATALATLHMLFELQDKDFVIHNQHRDLEGRWLLLWEATPPGMRGVTRAQAFHDELVLFTGFAPSTLWAVAEPFFQELLATFHPLPVER